MRVLAVVVVLLALGRAAAAEPAAPLRVTIECEDEGRTKACSAFLLSFIEANPLFLSAPRAVADVVLYVSAQEIALVDRVHLRFVGRVPAAPPVIEADVDIDTRADDDTQRAQLEPAFLRGIALFVAARHPEAVTVTLAAADAAKVATPVTSPYGVALDFGGSGNYTENYQSASGYLGFSVSRLTARHRVEASANANAGLSRSPPLQLEDGTAVSLDTHRWSLGGGASGAYLLNRCWSLGGSARFTREDDKAQFRHNTELLAGIEWDRFEADDPRGNRLAIIYLVGYAIEKYNLRNELGDTFAHFPQHALVANGSVRKDKISVGLSVVASSQLFHPGRRHQLSASPYIEWQLGDHVDINLGFSIAKREIVEPDPAAIDPSDYEQLSRLSYADPLQMNGWFNVRLHWDRTNGARNDRFIGI